MNTPEWSYLCQKTFSDLNGSELSQRHCSDCDLVVINFDVLTENERFSIIKEAAISGRRLCVALSQTGAGAGTMTKITRRGLQSD